MSKFLCYKAFSFPLKGTFNGVYQRKIKKGYELLIVKISL
ncbi:hypothetical protein T4C_9548 [Trichinella pseudospiralis]|uniref:Uncharacterized protein n=1 Tax=Trichinella pseudospiralis TaxID=6337 RepID=A0A0V1G8N4_TRIPS|nr:hypothetical protein T4C_9548 [Trichinella pseudospiralis]